MRTEELVTARTCRPSLATRAYYQTYCAEFNEDHVFVSVTLASADTVHSISQSSHVQC